MIQHIKHKNKLILPGLLFLLLNNIPAFSNNFQVSNILVLGQNTAEDYTLVQFDISWENSWRYAGGPGNWDAAWIFVKYKVDAGPWMHAQ